MSEKTKLSLISVIIGHYYEFFSCSNDAENAAVLEAVLDFIDTVVNYCEGGEEECRHCGECQNCAE